MAMPSMSPVIRRCLSGDQQAQEELVLAAQNRVYYHCRKMLKHEEDALDATQEILISMLTRLDRLQDPEAFWGWLSAMTANHCRNVLTRGRREAQIPEDDRLAVILNFRQAEQDQNAIAAEICAALKEQGIAGYAAGMGLVYGSPFQIDDSYVEALVAISEAMPLLPCGAHIFSTAEKLDEQSYQYPYAEYALIEQSIRNGNSGVAVDAIRHVVERIDKIGASPLIRKCLHFDLINMIIKVAATSRHPLSNAEIAQLSSWESKDALTQQLEGILRRLAEQAKSENAESQKSAKFALIDYVQTNFRDNALTLETLATHFNLSYTYVSKVFKEETGHTFLSYLTQLRFQTGQPFIDEVKCIGSGKGQIFLRVLIVVRYQEIQQVISPGRYIVLNGQGNDTRTFPVIRGTCREY